MSDATPDETIASSNPDTARAPTALRYDAARKYAGLLVPVFALRHARDFGIGDTLAVKGAIDFCAGHGFSLLQILPVHETIGDHSPYNAVSSHALSPALLSLTMESVPGLTREAVEEAAPESWLVQLRQGPVRHNSVQPLKMQILLAAHRAFAGNARFASSANTASFENDFAHFKNTNAAWLDDYTLYRLLVREYEGNPNWTEWRPEHQSPAGAKAWLARQPDHAGLEFIRDGYAFIQWVGWRQWLDVRRHAEARGVFLMGEMSFGVGRCSADVWAHPELFDLEWNVGSQPIGQIDATKDTERWGQNWGLPAYRWENHRSANFAWLRERIASERQFFHACRIDHLRGYFRAYMFPWPGGVRHAEFSQLGDDEVRKRTGGRMPRFVPGSDDDPTGRKMAELQGREILAIIKNEAGDMHLVGEILGIVIDYMQATLDDLQFANLTFPPFRKRPDGTVPPISSLRPLSLVAYANHDQPPLAATYAHLRSQAKQDPTGVASQEFLNLLALAGWKPEVASTNNGDSLHEPPADVTDALLAGWMETLMSSPCQLAVVMSSDLLGITQRFNLPGSYGAGTWCERLEHSLQDYIKHAVYGPRIATICKTIQRRGRNEQTLPREQGDVIIPAISSPQA